MKQYDSMGRIKRPVKFPVRIMVRLSEDANATLEEMAEKQKRKPAKVLRRAIMKDIYIYKAKKKKGEI